jgi:ParB-like chromosome segregation protein Spo0J
MTTIKIAELVFDTTVYPRMNIDSAHVGHIAQAMQAGADMPPIVVEKKTYRIIDGFHRGKALMKLFGPDHEIEVVEKSYRTEAALFLDAIRYNSGHGAKLDTYDRTHCVLLAQKLGIDTSDLAEALHVNEDWIGKMAVDRTANAGRLAADAPKGASLTVPIKKTIKHMAGKTLNKVQQEANVKLSGMNQSFYANQLITLIESRLLDTSDERLLDRLKVLHDLLEDLLVAK